MNDFDISAFGANGGGAFDSTTGEHPILEPRQKHIELIQYGNEWMQIPVSSIPLAKDFYQLPRIPYVDGNSYNNLPVVAAAHVRLFDPIQPFSSLKHSLPRDKQFIAYIAGLNSTGEYVLLDAVVLGDSILAPHLVQVQRLMMSQPATDATLEKMLLTAPKHREQVFPEPESENELAFYCRRTPRVPQEGQRFLLKIA